jgi:hypothetical protein
MSGLEEEKGQMTMKNLLGVSSTARLQAAHSAGCAAYRAGTRGAFGGNPHAYGATHEEYALAREWMRGYASAREGARSWSTYRPAEAA